MGRQKDPETLTRQHRIRLMIANRAMTVREIHEESDIKLSTVKRLLYVMACLGQVVCVRTSTPRPVWMSIDMHRRLYPGEYRNKPMRSVQGVDYGARFLPTPEVVMLDNVRITRQAAPAGRFEVAHLPEGAGAISQDWLRRRAGMPVETRLPWLR